MNNFDGETLEVVRNQGSCVIQQDLNIGWGNNSHVSLIALYSESCCGNKIRFTYEIGVSYHDAPWQITRYATLEEAKIAYHNIRYVAAD